MIQVYTAPEEQPDNSEFSVFMAGGITNCPWWQHDVIDMFKNYFDDREINLFNPRRENFPVDKPGESDKQIEWEFECIENSEVVLFWFARGTLNPIVLFEYGKELGRGDSNLVVGCDLEYERIYDVKKQTELHNKSTVKKGCRVEMIHDNLGSMVREVVDIYDKCNDFIDKPILRAW